jgi:hypothetical protein
LLIVDGGRTLFKPVETGGADAKQVLVRKGLAGGESVVAVAEGVAADRRVRPASGAVD